MYVSVVSAFCNLHLTLLSTLALLSWSLWLRRAPHPPICVPSYCVEGSSRLYPVPGGQNTEMLTNHIYSLDFMLSFNSSSWLQPYFVGNIIVKLHFSPLIHFSSSDLCWCWLLGNFKSFLSYPYLNGKQNISQGKVIAFLIFHLC